MPCVTVEPDVADWLIATVQRDPTAVIRIDVAAMTLTCAGRTVAARLPRPAQEAFLSGGWDATGMLLDDEAATRAVAARLPYVSGFARG
jgi:3-isopropylmalate/(R)-2-methylmalate dehydratase small subunit